MKKKITEYERFMALTDAQKDAEVAKYDREDLSLDQLKPLSREDRRLHARAARRGRPRVGQGAKRVLVSVERGLLADADAAAHRLKISRSELVARGLRAAITLVA
jgi:hypothetical protein